MTAERPLVLLADKDPYQLEEMRSDLAGPDFEVVTAGDGRQVLALAAQRRPDIVIAAASLGQMGGFAIARELKMLADRSGSPPPPAIAVLIEREADAWLAAWSRCDAWRTKPIDPDELRALVRELRSVATAAP